MLLSLIKYRESVNATFLLGYLALKTNSYGSQLVNLTHYMAVHILQVRDVKRIIQV